MSKAKNKDTNIANEVNQEELDKQAEIADGVIETQDTKNENKTKDAKKEDKKDKKKKKEKNKNGGLAQKAKGTMSELKKVTWPSFGDVVKKTGIVIVFVIIFGLMVFAIDTLLAFLSQLLIG